VDEIILDGGGKTCTRQEQMKICCTDVGLPARVDYAFVAVIKRRKTKQYEDKNETIIRQPVQTADTQQTDSVTDTLLEIQRRSLYSSREPIACSRLCNAESKPKQSFCWRQLSTDFKQRTNSFIVAFREIDYHLASCPLPHYLANFEFSVRLLSDWQV